MYPAIIIAGILSNPFLNQVINEDHKLLANDAASGDHFGISVAINNNIVVVGAYEDDDNSQASGSAYLFNASTGSQTTKLLANDGAAGDFFGRSVAINSGIVSVGAYGDNDNGGTGSAYLFNSSTDIQIAKLLPSDGGGGDQFGYTLASSNGIVAIGSYLNDAHGTQSGSVYLYDATTGLQLRKITPADAQANDWFGYSIAFSDGLLAIGALGDDDNGDRAGSAYIFDASSGSQIAKLLPSDGYVNDQFGHSIAIDSGIVAVGAYLDDDAGSGSGSAYIFDASTGIQLLKILPNDGAPGDLFGYSIAISDGVLAVGALWEDDSDFNAGSAYLFNIKNGTQIAKLLASDGQANDEFGYSLAMDHDKIVVGAWFDDDNGSKSGSAYIFSVPNIACGADLNEDGEADFLDISAFLNAYANHEPLADLNNDSNYDFLDISDFLTSYSAGCP